jgi:hypothetical protein
LLLAFALIHALLVKFGFVDAIGDDGRRVPFAPAIAAALIGIFMLGCLERTPTSINPIQGLRNSGQVSPPQSR